VHSVSQRPNLRHLGEPLAGAERPLEAVSLKKTTEGMGRGRVGTCESAVCVRIESSNTRTDNRLVSAERTERGGV